MTTQPSNQQDIPIFLNIKDVVAIVTVAVTVAFGYGVFGSRLSAVETQNTKLLDKTEKITEQLNKLNHVVALLEHANKNTTKSGTSE